MFKKTKDPKKQFQRKAFLGHQIFKATYGRFNSTIEVYVFDQDFFRMFSYGPDGEYLWHLPSLTSAQVIANISKIYDMITDVSEESPSFRKLFNGRSIKFEIDRLNSMDDA